LATITKTIGTTARDYSTITLWEADLDNDTPYDAGDDAIGECYADSDFGNGSADEAIVFNGGGTLGLNSIELTVASADRHLGIAGNGVRILLSGTSQYVANIVTNIIIDWIEIDCNAQHNRTGFLIAPDINVNLIHPMLHGSVVTSLYSNLWGIDVGSNLDATVNIVRAIVYSLDASAYRSATGIRSSTTDASAQINFLNCTVHNIKAHPSDATRVGYCYEFKDYANRKIQNCIGTDPTGTANACYNVSAPVNSVVDHNLASDTTASGAGSLNSKTSANQYISTVVGSENLHLKTGADAIDAGTDLVATPTGIEIDIDGLDINADSSNDPWDMGADEFVGAPPAGTWPHNPLGHPLMGSFGGLL